MDLRRLALSALLGLPLACGPAAAAKRASAPPATEAEAAASPEARYPVGGAVVTLRFPPGFVEARTAAPGLHRATEASAIAEQRMLGAWLHADDAARMARGQQVSGTWIVALVPREAEPHALDLATWRQLRPAMAEQLRAEDLAAQVRAENPDLNRRLDKAMPAEVAVDVAPVGRQVIYRDDDAGIRFDARMDNRITVDGRETVQQLWMAGAVARIGERLVVLYAYRVGDHGEAGRAEVRGLLDAVLDGSLD